MSTLNHLLKAFVRMLNLLEQPHLLILITFSFFQFLSFGQIYAGCIPKVTKNVDFMNRTC